MLQQTIFLKLLLRTMLTKSQVFLDLSRFEIVETSRKLFDLLLDFRKSKTMSSVGDAAFSSMTEDDRHIVEYIGGYILRRLKQKFLNQ